MQVKNHRIRNAFLLLLLATITTSSYAFVDKSKRIFNVAGNYNNPFLSSSQPLLASSADDGETWLINEQIPGLPGVTKSLKFTASTWHDNGNLLVGSYKDRSGAPQNNLFVVKNNIAQGINNLPNEFKRGKLSDITCTATTCISVGYYTNQDRNAFPLVMLSQDNGTNWHYSPLTTTTPADFVKGKLEKINCVDNNCVAVGNYTDTSGFIQPYIIRSTDNGLNWQAEGTIVNVPAKLKDIRVDELKCEKDFCLVAGSYTNFADKDKSSPFVLVENKTRTGWTFTPLNSSLPDLYGDLHMNKISCGGENCLVSGIYQASHDKTFLFSSSDHGITWTEIKDGTLNSTNVAITCTSDYCIGAGRSNASGHDFGTLALYQSKDAGKTWTTLSNVPRLHFPAIGATQCVDSTCVITGASVVDTYTRPYILVSHDKGLGWKTIELKNDPFYRGAFTTLNHSN